MRWQLTQHGWPINGGAHYVPVGTIITDDLMWGDSGIKFPVPLPINARALNQSAYDQLCKWYPNQLHLLQFDPHTVKGVSL
jgi:hypothetical protein